MRGLPTVTIDRGGKKVVINKSDFDPNKHSLWGAKPEGDVKGRLIAELSEFGISKDRRSSVESLQTALDEAKQ